MNHEKPALFIQRGLFFYGFPCYADKVEFLVEAVSVYPVNLNRNAP